MGILRHLYRLRGVPGWREKFSYFENYIIGATNQYIDLSPDNHLITGPTKQYSTQMSHQDHMEAPKHNGPHFADDICEGLFLTETCHNLIQFSLKFVPKGQIDNASPLVQVIVPYETISQFISLSAAYIRRWTGLALVQVMACRLSGAKSLPDTKLTFYQLGPWEQLSVKLESKYKTFIHENACENVVCEMSVILFRGRWVKPIMT